MKKLFITVALLGLCTWVNAQWLPTGATTGTIYYNGGNVGIGITTPPQTLTVNGSILSTTNYGLMIAPPSGDAIIKRSNSGALFLSSGGGTSDIKLNYNYGGGSGGITVFDGGVINSANFSVNSGGNLTISPSGGNVGIGTITPADQLEIVNGNRKVGLNTVVSGVSTGGIISLSRPDDGSKTMLIGATAAPADDNVIFSQGGNSELRFVSNGGPFVTAGFSFYNNISVQSAFGSARPVPVMKIDGNGNVGIGTAVPDAKLAVTGQVHAQEVKVSVTVPGPDYVFEKDYKLPSLEEIKNYIDQNKHLPEVPSAKEMEKNGVQLGEMNMLFLKKIEELTLYIIKQEERIKILEETKSKK